jgi:diguanylate cyclase (GGDEF)-like protein
MGIKGWPRGRYGLEVALASVALMLVVTPMATSLLPVSETVLINLATVIAATIAAHTAWRAARMSRGQTGRGWTYIAFGTLAWAGGEFLWLYFEGIRGVEAPFPSLADASYVAAYPLLLAGVLHLGTPLRRAAMLRTLLDAAVIALVATAMSWVYVLEPIASDNGATAFEIVLGLSYPAGDLLLVFGLVVAALRRPTERAGLILGTLGAGLAMFLAADFAFAILSQSDSFASGSVLDVLWLGGYALIACSAVCQIRWPDSKGTEDTARVSAPWRQAIPLAMLLAALAWAWIEDAASASAWAPTLLIAALAVVLMRSILTMNDVLSLNRELDDSASRLEAMNIELSANTRRLNKLLIEAVALSRRDSLTGLLNHASIMEELALALKDHPSGVVVGMLDVDHMKRINDEGGHKAGDEALRQLARLLEAQEDLVAVRYGGDEFLVFSVSPGVSQPVLEDLLDGVVGALAIQGIGVSYGVAAYPVDALAIGELIDRADRRLYRAKRARDEARLSEHAA